MFKIKEAAASIIFVCLSLRCAGAETITLKSGKVFDAEIIEKAKDYIKVKYNGLEIYYENKYIQSIENPQPVEPATAAQKETLVSESEPALKKGMELAAAGNLVEARQEFEKQFNDLKGALSILDAVEKGSLSRELAAYLFQGSLHILNKEYELAKAPLEKAWEMDPKDPDVNYNLGFVYFSLREYDKSIAYLIVTLKFQPDDVSAYELIAKDYCNIGEYQKARENLLIARELSKKNGDENELAQINELIRIVETITP
jgi:tetratricopeptide (TPR) repeat protein